MLSRLPQFSSSPFLHIGKLRLSDVPKVKHLLRRITPIRVFYNLTSTPAPHHIMASVLELRHLEKPLQEILRPAAYMHWREGEQWL